MKWLTVVPAYGKDYKSQKEVLEAYHSGKDFLISDVSHRGGSYISKREHPEDVHLTVRYGNGMRVHVIKPSERLKNLKK
jgi:hypothetical protein